MWLGAERHIVAFSGWHDQKEHHPSLPKQQGSTLKDRPPRQHSQAMRFLHHSPHYERRMQQPFYRGTTYPTHGCRPTLLGVRHNKGSRGEKTSPARKRGSAHPASQTAFIVFLKCIQKSRNGPKQTKQKSTRPQSNTIKINKIRCKTRSSLTAETLL
ncbi:hypothetical protein AVEN_97115-1 [Araneus ventricosus]|uniref:Uncharacterized protein n=1 Tax=Araneus ventricosus TaxID=182803 RepID=A0A4Y2SUQ1_ARAVE|nr:hypothetical protein AVEN_97115-1 [Araneus ventricosus]